MTRNVPKAPKAVRAWAIARGKKLLTYGNLPWLYPSEAEAAKSCASDETPIPVLISPIARKVRK